MPGQMHSSEVVAEALYSPAECDNQEYSANED